MQHSQLDRLLKLAKRTGDRLIVTSNDGAEPVVILPLAEYEGMLDAMTFFRSQGEGTETGEDQDNQAGTHEHVQKFEITEDPEEDFDPVALERQVMAAMSKEEPEVVPVEPLPGNEVQATAEETPRKPIIRKAKPEDDGGEERFYLEAV